jgi:hypothetical protein
MHEFITLTLTLAWEADLACSDALSPEALPTTLDKKESEIIDDGLMHSKRFHELFALPTRISLRTV